MKYYNRVTRTELFLTGPAHLIHNEDDLDHVVLDEDNPFFSPLPEGQQLTYDESDIPDGLEPIPAPVYTAQEQAAIDLEAAGVTAQSVAAAIYLDTRGLPDPLSAIDAAIDLVVISSGLTLAEVSGLVL